MANETGIKNISPSKLSTATAKPHRADGQPNTVEVKITRKVSLELIALAANIYNLRNMGGRMVFPAQAIRMIREEYIKDIQAGVYKSDSIVITLALMNGKPDYYTKSQINVIKNSLALIQQDFPIPVIKEIRLCIFTIGFNAEVVPYLNNGKNYSRDKYLIGRWDIFAHGHPGDIDLGYDLDATVQKNFFVDTESFQMISSKAFHPLAALHSWACRTGAPIDGSNKGPSLASAIVKHLNIPVYCFIRKSDYAHTWGDWTSRAALKNCKINPFAELVMEDGECAKLIRENDERETSMINIRAVWMSYGALYPVKSGTNPPYLVSGVHRFAPNEPEPIQGT